MRKCSGYHRVSKSQFHQKVDIEPLCCQPLIHSHIFLIHSTFLAFPNVTDQKKLLQQIA